LFLSISPKYVHPCLPPHAFSFALMPRTALRPQAGRSVVISRPVGVRPLVWWLALACVSMAALTAGTAHAQSETPSPEAPVTPALAGQQAETSPVPAVPQSPAEAVVEELPALTLKRSAMLQDDYPKEIRAQQPVYVEGDEISGQPDVNTVVEGNAELRRGDTVIRADRLEYVVPDDRVEAQGSVYINRTGNVYKGEKLDLQVDAFHGFFDQASYRFLANSAYGDASRIDFVDRDHAVVHNATYTTCQRDNSDSWTPAWMLSAKKISLDMAEEVGVAQGAALEFKGTRLLPLPSISFPLSDKRKSGLLPPTIALDKVSGFTYVQPYYWNLAPNRDMTLTPAVMAKRGAALGTRLRYLEPTYSGDISLDVMPNDKLRDRNRWGLTAKHTGSIATDFGTLGLNINLNRVSDGDYWRDFTQVGRRLRDRLLPTDLSLSWGGYDQSVYLRTLKWQALQNVDSPITPPYNLMPQLQWRYTPLDMKHGLDFSILADTTRFEAGPELANRVNGQRSYAVAQISRPFLSSSGFLTPKLQLHATNYQTDTLMSNGMNHASRVLPTFSLDGGLVFERPTSLFGRAFTQTLEPRAFYTYTPYRDQSMLPVYDTARNDFNFASIYSENVYGGQDRIADANMLTLGVTTRFIDPKTGAEAARFGVAQRVRFSDQRRPAGRHLGELDR
jgi:LPS-assembly protein